MLYKPKFCCHCGEKIERTEWKILTSRRFCELCATEFVGQDWIPRIVLVIGVLFGFYGIGSIWQKSEQPLRVSSNPPIKEQLKSNENSANPPVLAQTLPGVNNQPLTSITTTNSASEIKTQIAPQTKNLKAKEFGLPQNQTTEPVYFCGAQTKKGTPCSRRVKGGGRCWQHIGQTAMLPPDKLVISR